MIRLEAAECPHATEVWDLISKCWRCADCGEVPFVADQLGVEKPERPVRIGDPEPVDDRRELRFPR